MVGEEVALNLTEFISVLSPQIIEKIEGFIVVLKAVGIAVIAYIIYVVAMSFISIRRAKQVKNIEEKIKSMNKKLDILLKAKKKR